MLGEGVGQAFGEFQVGEVITICDHLGLFAGIQPENKIL